MVDVLINAKEYSVQDWPAALMENVLLSIAASLFDANQDGDATMDNVTQSKDIVHHHLNANQPKFVILTSVLTIVQLPHAQQEHSVKETDVYQ